MDRYEAVATNATISALELGLRDAVNAEASEDLQIAQSMCFAPMHPNGFTAHVMMSVHNLARETFQVVAKINFVRQRDDSLRPTHVELQVHSAQWQ